MLNNSEGTVGESQPFLLSIDITNEKEYNYVYEDGVIVRSTECDITVNGEVITNRFPVNTIIYTYNGGALVKKRIIPENGFDTEHVYTYPKDNGNTASCTFERGDTAVTATFVTDGLGRAVSESIATGSGTISRSFTYTDGVAPLIEAPLDTNEYKPTTKLVSKMELSDGTVLDYEYDACGRITKVTETRSGTATVTEYTYDALGQLLTETVNGTPVNCMSYDSYGNIQEKNGVAYGYDAAWKDRLTSVGDHSITYGSDPCNPATYFGNSLVWENGRQLKQFGNYTYKYNANGIRTRKTVNNINHFYTLDGTKILREIWGTDSIVPIYDTNESVIGLTRSTESGTNTYYFLKNLQGDVIEIYTATGTLVAEYVYDAWGRVISVKDASGNVNTDASFIGNINPFRYRSYYYDTETGLYYLNSRYYDPEIGRFINADDVQYLDPETLGGLSLYAYCLNNPVNMADPAGNAPKWWQWAISGSLVVAGVVLIATGVGGPLGGALICAGANSIINSYITEASGGSSVAGWVGGLITGATCGLGAGFAGNFFLTATKATGIACIKYLSYSVTVAFVFGSVGSGVGQVTSAAIDRKEWNFKDVAISATTTGLINCFSGIGAGIGEALKAMPTISTTTTVVASTMNTAWSVVSEAICDFLGTISGLFSW